MWVRYGIPRARNDGVFFEIHGGRWKHVQPNSFIQVQYTCNSTPIFNNHSAYMDTQRLAPNTKVPQPYKAMYSIQLLHIHVSSVGWHHRVFAWDYIAASKQTSKACDENTLRRVSDANA